ncbi:hypothetical protein ES319_A09G044700v1 [Gossypium barbadense]|uniref:SAYSvFN domain-containing protein n=2 Tax=Gossypium TaxID=3633 RepID=A0A5J5UAP2_GOSBA|nr:hypothetical protein ES319_A09G044700v1 [Gossypium barbadense]TYH01380.1 hypothetical protein ES288_A09G053400v1 [Gossypium darwinii]
MLKPSCSYVTVCRVRWENLLLNVEVYHPCQLFPSLSETKFSTFTLKSIFSRWVKVLKLSASVALLLWMFLLLVDPSDSLIVAVKPKAPSGLDIDDDEEDLKFQLPQSTSQWKKKLYSFLLNRLKLPDILLMAIFSLSLKAWILVILWFILAHVAHKWDLGPLYILGTGFCTIFLNLGRRQPGDVSAYSIFNEDFRELPGTLNADSIAKDIRTDQF